VAATADRVISLFDGEVADDASFDDSQDLRSAAHVVKLLG
jgi:hypothetical protein